MPIPATAPTPCRVLDNGVVQLTPTTKRVPPSQETPSLKPHEHLTHTPRNTYGRLIQCQTSHAFLGEYYATNMSPQKTSPAFAVNQSRRRTTLASCPLRKPPLSQGRLRRHRHIRHSRHQRRCRSTYVDKFTVAKIPRCHKRVQEATHPTRSSPSLSPLPRICAPSPNTLSLVQFLNYLVNNKTFVPIF